MSLEKKSRGTCPPCCTCETDAKGEMCYVEGSNCDNTNSVTMQDVNDKVWESLRPPVGHHENPPPTVTARKIDIVRAQLMNKTRYRSNIPKTNPN